VTVGRHTPIPPLRDRLLSCAENLEANGYSESIVEETAKELLHAKKVLTEFECGLQFAKDLAVTNQLVASRTDHRSVEVVRSCCYLRSMNYPRCRKKHY